MEENANLLERMTRRDGEIGHQDLPTSVVGYTSKRKKLKWWAFAVDKGGVGKLFIGERSLLGWSLILFKNGECEGRMNY